MKFLRIKMLKNKKGFTLIELLVVIAIVAVLSVVVILTLNPAELLKQARDSNRVSDMATLKSAVALYLADQNSPLLGTVLTCYYSGTSTPMIATSTVAGAAICRTATASSTAPNGSANQRKVDGTGWLPVDLTKISSGAPVGNLPIDPVNSKCGVGGAEPCIYSFISSSTLTYELDSLVMESSKYRATGSGDVVTTDGGDNNTAFEVGTVAGLAL